MAIKKLQDLIAKIDCPYCFSLISWDDIDDVQIVNGNKSITCPICGQVLDLDRKRDYWFETIGGGEDGGGITVERDPTVPSWAKQKNKPSYNADQINYSYIKDGITHNQTVDQSLTGLKQDIDTISTSIDGLESGVQSLSQFTNSFFQNQHRIVVTNPGGQSESIEILPSDDEHNLLSIAGLLRFGKSDFIIVNVDGKDYNIDSYEVDYSNNQSSDFTLYTSYGVITSSNGEISFQEDSSDYQQKLVSGTNIKTINNESLLGSGNISISGGSGSNTFYSATSSSSAGTQSKIVTCENFIYNPGDIVEITFTNANTATGSLKLNINNTGLKDVKGTSTNPILWGSNNKVHYFLVGQDKYIYLTSQYNNYNNVYIGTCDTNAATSTKVCNITNFSKVSGATIYITFTKGNSINSAPSFQLDISGTGATMVYNYTNFPMDATELLKIPTWTNGAILKFIYDGSNYRYIERLDGKATKQYVDTAISEIPTLPAVTSSDQGSSLCVNSNGQWVIQNIYENIYDELGSYVLPEVNLANEGNILRVDNNGEWSLVSPNYFEPNIDDSSIQTGDTLVYENNRGAFINAPYIYNFTGSTVTNVLSGSQVTLRIPVSDPNSLVDINAYTLISVGNIKIDNTGSTDGASYAAISKFHVDTDTNIGSGHDVVVRIRNTATDRALDITVVVSALGIYTGEVMQ